MNSLSQWAWAVGILIPVCVRSATLSSGSATLDLDPVVWNTLAVGTGFPQPVLKLSAYFPAAEASLLTADEALSRTQTDPSYAGQVFALNGPTATSLAGRAVQPTTLIFSPGAVSQHSGSIGLGGLTRFHVSAGSELLFGDLSLQYDPARILFGGTGWYLKNNLPPAGALFDLLDVQLTETTRTVTLSAHLGISAEVANFLFATPADTLRDVGRFQFTGEILRTAHTVVGGAATLDFDSVAWDGLASGYGLPLPVLRLSGFFDSAQASALSQDQILTHPQVEFSYTNQTYTVNGAVVTNLPGRTSKPTTFTYLPGELAGHAGVIGLGGIARFSASAGGNLLYGDYTLQYDPARLPLGGSGWFLKGNIPPAAPAFDLLNLSLVETNGTLQIDGRLGVSWELANLLYSTPSDALKDVGRFRFTGATAPVPPAPARLTLLEVAKDQIRLQGRQGTPLGSYSLQSTSRLAPPGEPWSQQAVGVFDRDGSFTLTLPASSGAEAQFYRLRQP